MTATPSNNPNPVPQPSPQPQQAPSPAPQQHAQPQHTPAAAQPQQQAQQQTPPQQRPADTLRDGNVKATIWEREGQKGTFHTTTLSRTYRDQEGNYKDSRSFSGTDLLRVSELAKDAYHRTQELRREQAQVRQAEQSPQQPQSRDERRAAFDTQRQNNPDPERGPHR